MAIDLTVNGTTFSFPEAGDRNWATNVTGWAQEVTDVLAVSLLKTGGTMTGFLTLNAAPTATLHAATKGYVDDALMGLRAKTACRVATTEAGVLSGSFEDGDTVDGITLATGDRILIKDQAAPAENGIYVVAASGSPTRATDADVYSELFQAFVAVTAGTENASTNWLSGTPQSGTIDVDAITFGQFGSAGTTTDGEGIEIDGNELSVELDGGTLSKSASGIKVADLGIANAQVSTTAAMARTKLAAGTSNRLVYNVASTGVMGDLAAITAARALISDANGLPTHSDVTSVELGYLDNLSSNAQTQLDAKAATADILGKYTIALSGAGVHTDDASPTTPFGPKALAANAFAHQGWSMPSGSASRLYATFVMPKSWNRGALLVRVFYFHEGGQTSGQDGVRLSIAARSYGQGDALTTAHANAVNCDADQSAANTTHVTAQASLTVQGTPQASEQIQLRIERPASATNNDLNVPVIPTAIEILYTADALNDD